MTTTNVELPPLPQALAQALTDYRCGEGSREEVDANVRDYALQAVLRERERCAKLADDMDYGMGELAAAIRGEKK